MSGHDVRRDRAGWSDRLRLTCYGPACEEATVVAQPYMSQVEWDDITSNFLLAHPSGTIGLISANLPRCSRNPRSTD